MNSLPEKNSQNGLSGDASLPPGDVAGQLEELAWTAQQYVLGELSHEELAAWEQRLLVDPIACEAVADAVALIERLDSVFSQQAVPVTPSAIPASHSIRSARPRTMRRFRNSYLALSAMSLLGVAALVTSWSLGPATFWSTVGTTPNETEVAAQLVGIWRSNAASSRPLANVSPEPLDVQVWGDDEAAADVPGWLLAAVSLDAASASDSDDWEDN